MGESIRKTAARDDILHDIRTTHESAIARGGVPASLAEQRLSPGNFKRMLKANGFTEADAHTMIPDRSSAPARKEASKPAPGDG